MKLLPFLFLAFFSSLFPHAIVFIHLGPAIPNHLPLTMIQAKRFNSDCPIYLIAEQKALDRLPKDTPCIPIACELLNVSSSHLNFKKNSKLDRSSAEGLWYYSTERFFYLEELMKSRNLADVFHLENDVLLYADLSSLLPIFKTHYPSAIGATFEQDFRCVPGFLYIPEPEPLSRLNDFLSTRTSGDDTDMQMIGLFKKMHPKQWIDHLPILPSEYIADHTPLASITRAVSEESEMYANHFEDFRSIFDAASFGIYLGGDDSRYHFSMPGKINPNCIFDPSEFQIEWERDALNRKYPVAIYKGRKIKINNLHLTNKVLISSFVMDGP